MKKLLAGFGLLGALFACAGVSHAGTPAEAFYQGQAPLSGTTILGSTAATVSNVNLVVTVSTPTSTIGSGTTSCRNCFTRFFVQVATTAVVSLADGPTTKWTIYGTALGTTGTNSLSIPEDHLGPWCTSTGNATVISVVNTLGNGANPQVVNYEGYTQCGGTANAGPMN